MTEPGPEVGVPKASPRVVIPEKATLGGRLAARLIFLAVRSMDATLRYELEDPAHSLAEVLTRPAIFAIWHNRLALSLMLYRRYVLQRTEGRRMAAIVSASRDGGMLARALELFRVQPVRGSSSRRGARAMLEMTAWAQRGYDLAVTPDGPRGPRYVVQGGVVAAAQLTGLPILPVSVHIFWKRQFRSWDGFQLPLPFSRCRVRLGSMVRVPRDLSEAEHEVFRQLVETRLRALTQD
jgi:lysophospholipid acyltransferase (LPLAT)-like uncharacterized protein